MTPKPPLAAISADLRTLADYERRAREHIAPEVWAHLHGGADGGVTLADNRAAFDRLRWRPRALVDLRGGHCGVDLLGQRHAAPLLLAPLAYHRLVHPDGEIATARGAAAMQTTMVVSTLASVPLEDIAAAADATARELDLPRAPRWFQLYLQAERAASRGLVERAEAAGYAALVLTVDAAVKRSEFALPAGVEAANLRGPAAVAFAAPASIGSGRVLFGTPLADAAPTWDDLAWLRATSRLPILVKGLLDPADARQAIEAGADGVIVSNHGGRVLDGLPAAIDALPDVVEAVAGRGPVLMDGGIRRGTDVAKALAAGAAAVLVGRPQVQALATAGPIGVAHMLYLLRAELELAMAQLGCPTVERLRAVRLERR